MAWAVETVRRTVESHSEKALGEAQGILGPVGSDPKRARSRLAATVPALVDYYTDGTAALAADWYADRRDETPEGRRSRFRVIPVNPTDPVKIGRGVGWATDPLFDDDLEDLGDAFRWGLVGERLADVIEFPLIDGFTETIEENTRQDPVASGWARETRAGACPFCLMLAEHGAVYRKEDTARFAAHTGCNCVAVPMFGDVRGAPLSTVQYIASRRYRTEAQREKNNARIRDYLKANYGHA